MKAGREGQALASRQLHGGMKRQTKDWIKAELTGCDEDKIEGGGNICSRVPSFLFSGTQARRYQRQTLSRARNTLSPEPAIPLPTCPHLSKTGALRAANDLCFCILSPPQLFIL